MVHDVRTLQELCVAPELLSEERSLLRPELERPVAADPIDVLEDGTRFLACLILGVLAADRRALQVKGLVDIAVRRE